MGEKSHFNITFDIEYNVLYANSVWTTKSCNGSHRNYLPMKTRIPFYDKTTSDQHGNESK